MSQWPDSQTHTLALSMNKHHDMGICNHHDENLVLLYMSKKTHTQVLHMKTYRMMIDHTLDHGWISVLYHKRKKNTRTRKLVLCMKRNRRIYSLDGNWI